MNVTCESTNTNEVKLTVEIPAERFDEAMEKAFIRLRKQISIPGFRPGRAPRKIIENFYTEAVFYDDAMDILLPEAYDAAVKEADIFPVDRPEVDIVEIGSGKPVVFTAQVTVKPEVHLGDYKGLEVERHHHPVTDADVDAEVETAAARIARWIDAERPVENGDRVMLDYAGSVDGVAFDGGTAENQSLEIGSGRFIPGFEEQLVGLKVGEEKDIEVTFPEEYHEATLAGKPAVFHVRINEIKMREMPEIDDEFAKDVSEFDTLEEYKADIRKNLEEHAAEHENDALENALVSQATDNATIEVPECMIEQQMDSILREMELRLSYQGLRLADYLQITQTSLEDMREQSREDATRRVRTELVLEAIAKAEDLQVDDEAKKEEYARLAEVRRQTPEEFEAALTDSEREYLEANLKAQGAIKFLKDHAKVVEEKKEAKPKAKKAAPKAKAAGEEKGGEAEKAEKPAKTAKKAKADDAETAAEDKPKKAPAKKAAPKKKAETEPEASKE